MNSSSQLQNFTKTNENKPLICHAVRRDSIEKNNDDCYSILNEYNLKLNYSSTSNSIEQLIDEDGLNCSENEKEFLEASTSFFNITDEKFYAINDEKNDSMYKSVYFDANNFTNKNVSKILNQSIYEDALDEYENNNFVDFLIEIKKNDINEEKLLFFTNKTSILINKVDIKLCINYKENNEKICQIFFDKNYEFINFTTISIDIVFKFINKNFLITFFFTEIKKFNFKFNQLKIKKINSFFNGKFYK